MLQDIRGTIETLPKRVREICNDALDEAHSRGEYPDSSTCLLSMMQLGPSDSSVKWLHSIGVNKELIESVIESDRVSRPASSRTWGADEERNKATRAMLDMLDDLSGYKGHVFVYQLLEAIATSGSPVVERIFSSVNYSPQMVVHEMERSEEEESIVYSL